MAKATEARKHKNVNSHWNQIFLRSILSNYPFSLANTNGTNVKTTPYQDREICKNQIYSEVFCKHLHICTKYADNGIHTQLEYISGKRTPETFRPHRYQPTRADSPTAQGSNVQKILVKVLSA